MGRLSSLRAMPVADRLANLNQLATAGIAKTVLPTAAILKTIGFVRGLNGIHACRVRHRLAKQMTRIATEIVMLASAKPKDFWPEQEKTYFGVDAGQAKGWSEGDTVRFGTESFTISCIAIGDKEKGGETNCGNSKASFDIVVVDKAPTQRYPAGTCVQK
jgi:hypothetical protein